MNFIMKYISSTLSKGILALLSILFVPACSDYLEEEPSTNFSAAFVYNTPEGLELGVVSLYNINRSFYENFEWNNSIPLILEAKTDIVLARTGEISLYGQLTWGNTLSDFGTTRYAHFWRTYYRLADRANAIIKAAENAQGIDESQRNRILAEAKTFRALSFFTLYRLFNNIFVTTEPTTPENALNIINAKSSEAEIFGLINNDLTFAIQHLAWTTPEFGRLTQGTARHMKAQVAMWQQDYVEAKAQAEAVINSGYHELLPSTADVFKGDLNHKETLFAVQYAPLIAGGGAGNRFNFILMPQYGATPGAQYSQDQGNRGAGFLMPNQYLRALLAEDPNDDRAKNRYYQSTFYYNNLETLPPGKNLGDVIDTYNEFSTDASERTNFFARLNPGCKKFSQEDAIPTEATHYKNIMVYRLAETYLIAAEATWRISQNDTDTDALTYLNAVRTRANAAPATVINQQAILDEDARELAFENVRWYTLKRMGVMIDQIQQHAGNVYQDSDGNLVSFQHLARTRIQPHHVNLPIPQSEIDLLGPDYPQNEGY